jgi:hypothetical protein
MIRRSTSLQFFLLAIVLFSPFALRSASGDEPVGKQDYNRKVAPLLQKYCADCHHSTDASEDRWAFDRYKDYEHRLADHKIWHKAQLLVGNHIMPPADALLEPSRQERQLIVDWIEDAVFYVDPKRPDPGPATLRRLNRAEYNNTVRDVLGVTSQPANRFPEDDSGYGFDNIGEVLTISPLHYEKYRAAATQIADEVTALGPPPRVGIELKAEQITLFAGEPELRDTRVWLRSAKDEVGTTVVVPVKTHYRVLSRAATVKAAADEDPLPLEILCDGTPLGKLQPTSEFKGKPGAQATCFSLVELPPGEHRIALRLASPENPDDLPDALATISFMSVSGPFTPVAPTTSSFLQDAFPDRNLEVPVLRLSGEDLDAGSGRNSLDTGRAWFATNGYRHAPVLIPATSEYRVRFKVGAQQVGDENVKFELRVDDLKFGPFEVTAKSQAEQWIETRCELPAGQHDWQVWFVNEYEDPETKAERWFWLHEFTIAGPLDGDYGLSRGAATDLLQTTARRLFRRPLTDEENERLQGLVNSAVQAELSPRMALRVGLEALLISPKFLYHPLPEPAGQSEYGTALVDEFTLASRLSYFLWSSAPDDELLSLAEQGKLREQLTSQVKRMLADPKSAALTENFAGQWLQLRNLEHVSPNPETFPEYDFELAADMRRETELVFEYILQNNRSILEFLNADYTFLNPRLARHYQLPAPEGEGFYRVPLAGSPRRGVITHGSILTITSLPTRTSPVKRGKWLLEQFLGTEPPPPPGDIPPLPAASEDESLTLRQRLEAHRTQATCASCHAILDPYGFALENYDAIGRRKPGEQTEAIDTSGELITGEQFTDWSELRDLLVKNHRDEFLKCFVEQLLTYSLGRGTTYRDKLFIEDILARCEKSQFGFQDVLLALCESVPFQRMRTESFRE